ncbi:dihydrofolate reductase family protein [Microbacterium sp.]|uniref:dihydrofolate reductase family protein n=1 Tax=Microbacterium sp. TaxID=51671 RepID=UPI001AC68C2C|nr:dihydrofolate reductase family protein [Microbacterium sp.]MBN9157548.1 dihydrofolate reductase family protein [Microbacterium sp.]
MARIIVAQFITLDGVVEDPDGSGGTPFGGWCFRDGPAAISGDKFHYGSILQTGIFLFGRRTWEAFAAMWPAREETDAFARALNAADKAVVTGGDVDLSRWRNSRRVAADPIGWARETAAERDVVLIGSGSLVERFVEAGVVDEYRLRVFPTATGAGRRLFPDGAALDLVSVEQVGPTSLVIATPSVRGR